MTTKIHAGVMTTEIGYAVVVRGRSQLCRTSDWTGQSVWQVYRKREDAEAWAAQDFGDAEYDVVEVEIRQK